MDIHNYALLPVNKQREVLIDYLKHNAELQDKTLFETYTKNNKARSTYLKGLSKEEKERKEENKRKRFFLKEKKDKLINFN